MVESINEKQTIDINDLEDARVLLEREMNKITEVGQRITLLTSRVQSLTSLLGDLTDVN
jgi:ribosomal protein L16/L10AE